MSVYISGDPIADFNNWDAEQSRELEKLPRCSECHNRIMGDYYYEINGEVMCEVCLEEGHRKWVEDYVE